MSGTPLEFSLRTPDEALHSIGHIVPNADTRHLEVLLQKDSAPAHEILAEAHRFCDETSLGSDMVGHVCTLLVHADHLDAFDQTLSSSLAQLFLKLGTPPQG